MSHALEWLSVVSLLLSPAVGIVAWLLKDLKKQVDKAAETYATKAELSAVVQRMERHEEAWTALWVNKE